MSDASEGYLKSIDQNLAIIKSLLSDAVNANRAAEAEIPSAMRRFVMYMHDMHDVKNLYSEQGLEVPSYVLREVERCDDRLRQLLDKAHTDGGAFEKVRREMSADPTNRWDHTRLLAGGKT